MRIQCVARLTLPFAAAALLTVTALPAFGAGAEVPSLKDGKVHGFEGCLIQESAQESSGVDYFDLTNAKSDKGKDLGTVRLTGDLSGITNPKESLNKKVRVSGIYLGREGNDPGSGHVAVKDSSVVGEKCF
jgi:hypothetical protein